MLLITNKSIIFKKLKVIKMDKQRVSKLIELSYMIADEYHEDFFDSKTEQTYPRMFEQVVRHDAYERFGMEDLNTTEVNFVMKMVRDLVFVKNND